MIITTTPSIEGKPIADYHGVVGVDLDYEVINNMLMVSASGTAVTVG